MNPVYKCVVILCLLITNSEVKAQSDIIWEFQTEGRILSSVIYSNGTVYAGSNDHHLYALDSNSGAELWKFDTGAEVRTTPLILDNNVIVHSGNRLFALDKFTGKLAWKHEPEAVIGKELFINDIIWDFHYSSPALSNSVVYYGNDYGMIFGVNPKTGEEKFNYQTSQQAAIRTTPTITGDTLFFGDWNGYLHAIRLSSSEQIWEKKVHEAQPYPGYGKITSNILIDGEGLYFGGHLENFHVVNKSTGKMEVVYSHGGGGWVSSFPASYKDYIFTGGSDYHNLIAVNKSDKSIHWIFPIKETERIFSSPVFVDDMLIVATGGGGRDTEHPGAIYFVDIESGEQLGKFVVETKQDGIGEGILNTPFIEGDYLYFGTFSGKIYKIDYQRFLSDN